MSSNTATLPASVNAILESLAIALESKRSLLPMLRNHPVKSWDDMTAQNVLGNVLTFAHQLANPEAAGEILEYYRSVRNDDLPPELWVQTANLAPEVALWCRTWIGGNVIEYWRMLLNIAYDEVAVEVAKHLHTKLPLTQLSDWHGLIALMEPSAELAGPNEGPVPHHNQQLRAWLIRNQPLEDYPTILPSVLQYAKAIPRFFGEGLGKTMPVILEPEDPESVDGPQTTDEVIHQMITMYAGSRYLSRCKMAAAIYPNEVKSWPSYNDTPIHQRFGPVNALTTELVDVSDKPKVNSKANRCTRYGGCRMLTCQEFEQPDEDGDVEWFTKQCLHCQKPISEKEVAVRLPLLNGGWRGCFCEWYCVSEYIANVGYCMRDQDILQDLVDRFSQQLELTPIV